MPKAKKKPRLPNRKLGEMDFFGRFGKIEKQLKDIKEKLNAMATSQEQFDAKLKSFLDDITTKLSDAQKQLKAAVQAIIDKIAAQAPQVDLSAEAAQLEAAQVNFDSTVDSLPTDLPTEPTGPTPAEAITGKGAGEVQGTTQVLPKHGPGSHHKK